MKIIDEKAMNKKILNFLSIIGVDTRYISLYQNYILINNLKFSRFSRRREELFLEKHKDWKIIRSKIFQKMCIRASRDLSKSLNPRDKILIIKNGSCADLILYLILEPYTRKYGIKIIFGNSFDSSEDYEVDSIASSLTLDQEVGNILNQLFQGRKIELTNIKTENTDFKIIYPLINISDAWIKLWTKNIDLKCAITPADRTTEDLLNFLQQYIPDVRENILKSANYIKRSIKN